MWKGIGVSMQSYTECIPCFVRQAHDALRLVGSDERQSHEILQKVLVEAARFPLDRPPPAMAQTIHRIIREELGNPDPYARIKTDSTRLALKLAEEARAIIGASIDPFRMALRFSIAGNILDFALASSWNRLDLSDFIEQTRLHELADTAVERLRAAVKSAKKILFLGDNCGETVFDRLLIEQISTPKNRVIYAVKGSPVINDATLADALAADLDRVAELVENGSDAPGTLLEDCSAEFRRLFDRADLVIAKGQANYESLCEVSRPVFFLTRVKCPVIARDLGEPVGSWVIREHAGAGR